MTKEGCRSRIVSDGARFLSFCLSLFSRRLTLLDLRRPAASATGAEAVAAMLGRASLVRSIVVLSFEGGETAA